MTATTTKPRRLRRAKAPTRQLEHQPSWRSNRETLNGDPTWTFKRYRSTHPVWTVRLTPKREGSPWNGMGTRWEFTLADYLGFAPTKADPHRMVKSGNIRRTIIPFFWQVSVHAGHRLWELTVYSCKVSDT